MIEGAIVKIFCNKCHRLLCINEKVFPDRCNHSSWLKNHTEITIITKQTS